MAEPAAESPSALPTATGEGNEPNGQHEPNEPTKQIEQPEPNESNGKQSQPKGRRKRTRETEEVDCRDLTLRQIISRLKKRRGAKPMPSSVRRAQERRERRKKGETIEEAPDTAAAPSTPPPEESEATQESGVVAPQVTFDEDGNIVIDQASLVVSANAHPEEEGERDVTTVENHVFSSKVTSLSFKKREKSTRWTEEETEKFYAALTKYGSDFSLIEREIPGRTRKQLKAKYKREERLYPERITMAISRQPLPPLPPRRAVGRPRKGRKSVQNAEQTQSTQPNETQNNSTQQSPVSTAPAEPPLEQGAQRDKSPPPVEGDRTKELSQSTANGAKETASQRKLASEVSLGTETNNVMPNVIRETLPESNIPTKPAAPPSNQNDPSEAVNDLVGSPMVQPEKMQQKETDNNLTSNNCTLPSQGNAENNQVTANETSTSSNPTLKASTTNDAAAGNDNSNDISPDSTGNGTERPETTTDANNAPNSRDNNIEVTANENVTDSAGAEDPTTKDVTEPKQNNVDKENENREEDAVQGGLDKEKGLDGSTTEVVGRLDGAVTEVVGRLDDDEEHHGELDIMLPDGGFDSDDSEMNDGSGFDSD